MCAPSRSRRPATGYPPTGPASLSAASSPPPSPLAPTAALPWEGDYLLPVLIPSDRVGGRLRHPAVQAAWQGFAASMDNSFIASVVKSGFRVVWCGRTTMVLTGVGARTLVTPLPPPRLRRRVDSLARLPAPARSALLAEISELLRLGVIEETDPQDPRPRLFSRLFVLPKTDGTWRSIIDLRGLNDWTIPVAVSYPTIRQVSRELRRGDWMIKIDLSKAFFQVPLADDSRPLTSIAAGGATYQFTCLPMGLRSSPGVFMAMVTPLYALLRSRFPGTRTYVYSDDHLVVSHCRSTLTAAASWLRAALLSLGWLINEAKTCWQPQQRCEFLGFLLDAQRMELRLPGKKRRDVLREIRRWTSGPAAATLRDLARLLGKLNATTEAIPRGRLNSGGLQALSGSLSRSALTWDDPVPPSAWAAQGAELSEEISWWEATLLDRDRCTRSLARMQPNVLLATDASLTGYGGAVFALPPGTRTHEQAIEVSRTTAPLATYSAFIPTQERLSARSISAHEVTAVTLSVEAMHDHLSNKRIWLLCDSMVALAYIRKQRGRRDGLRLRTKSLFASLSRHGSTIAKMTYIKSAENTTADDLSRRGHDPDDYKCREDLFQQACETYQRTPTLDLFATATNRQATWGFCSKGPQPGAFSLDCMTLSWTAPVGPATSRPTHWANPPWGLIPALLDKVDREGAEIILVSPLWPTAPWRPLLQRLRRRPPLVIPTGSRIFSSGLDGSDRLAGPTRWDTEISLIEGTPRTPGTRGSSAPWDTRPQRQ